MVSKEEDLGKYNSDKSKKVKKYYDIAVNISENLATFLGDPCYKAEQENSLEEGVPWPSKTIHSSEAIFCNPFSITASY